MPKYDVYDVKQKCSRCTRERYELIQSPLPGDKTFVCNNCWNYLWKKHKKGADSK